MHGEQQLQRDRVAGELGDWRSWAVRIGVGAGLSAGLSVIVVVRFWAADEDAAQRGRAELALLVGPEPECPAEDFLDLPTTSAANAKLSAEAGSLTNPMAAPIDALFPNQRAAPVAVPDGGA